MVTVMSDWVSSFPAAEDARSKAAELAAKKRRWVAGSENTPEELAEIQPSLKQAFLDRENRRAA